MTECWGLFYLVWTVLCYFMAKQLFVRTQKIYLSPIIVVPSLCIVLIFLLQHQFQDYYFYTQYLVAMLGPITVAFAIPVFRYRRMIQQHFKVLLFSSSPPCWWVFSAVGFWRAYWTLMTSLKIACWRVPFRFLLLWCSPQKWGALSA